MSTQKSSAQPSQSAQPGQSTLAEVASALGRCLAGHDGDLVMGWLQAHVIARPIAPNCSDAELRHLEGQRHLASRLIQLAMAGSRETRAGMWRRIALGAGRLANIAN